MTWTISVATSHGYISTEVMSSCGISALHTFRFACITAPRLCSLGVSLGAGPWDPSLNIHYGVFDFYARLTCIKVCDFIDTCSKGCVYFRTKFGYRIGYVPQERNRATQLSVKRSAFRTCELLFFVWGNPPIGTLWLSFFAA